MSQTCLQKRSREHPSKYLASKGAAFLFLLLLASIGQSESAVMSVNLYEQWNNLLNRGADSHLSKHWPGQDCEHRRLGCWRRRRGNGRTSSHCLSHFQEGRRAKFPIQPRVSMFLSACRQSPIRPLTPAISAAPLESSLSAYGHGRNLSSGQARAH